MYTSFDPVILWFQFSAHRTYNHHENTKRLAPKT